MTPAAPVPAPGGSALGARAGKRTEEHQKLNFPRLHERMKEEEGEGLTHSLQSTSSKIPSGKGECTKEREKGRARARGKRE